MTQGGSLKELINIPMDTSMSSAKLAEALNTSLFVDVPGTFKTRYLGHNLLLAGLIYRFGSVSGLKKEGKEARQ